MRQRLSQPAAILSVLALALATLPLLAWAASGLTLGFSDPAGDDFGPGTYSYPTDPVYTPKSFDLRKLEVIDGGDTVTFRVTVGANIADPWNSRDWDGNGFSLQFVQIYVDRDHQKGAGFREPLPGLGSARFAEDEAWDKVVLISPQPRARLEAEIRFKAAKMKGSIIIPRRTTARGKTLVAVVSKADLGQPTAQWGFQAVVQSNEGYPDKADLLTRRVNEVRGEHRFGGGHDSDCDPHVLDILAGAGKGGADEVGAQKKALAWKCGSLVATLPMVYPSASR
jgi:carbohydrate-binding DOMON domain-containing protein